MDKDTTIPAGMIVYALIRHLLTGIGGFLVGKGILESPDAVNQLVEPTTAIALGAATYAIGQGASLVQKKMVVKKIATPPE